MGVMFLFVFGTESWRVVIESRDEIEDNGL